MTLMTTTDLQPEYAGLSKEEWTRRINEFKQSMGSKLVILGHHYQRDEVLEFTDLGGDSLKLAQLAAQQKDAEYIVFCGVHFMAESADILTGDNVKVLLPELTAGCSMADMATNDQLERAWKAITAHTDETIIPITYVNSTAEIKAFCGKHGGTCCTSGNAAKILDWGFKQGSKILFLPDQHLGRNTAHAMGVPLDQMSIVHPGESDYGLSPEGIKLAKVLLWEGYCEVHQRFTPEQCCDIRQADPDMKIIVHPECQWSVVKSADQSGSTEQIIKAVADSPAGSHWAIGTETHLVDRLTHRHPDKVIRPLSEGDCLCPTMTITSPQHLLRALDSIVAGNPLNVITVPDEIKTNAKLALDRMLACV